MFGLHVFHLFYRVFHIVSLYNTTYWYISLADLIAYTCMFSLFSIIKSISKTGMVAQACSTWKEGRGELKIIGSLAF